MARPEQHEATVRTVRAMIDGAAEEMQRLRPGARVGRFDDLTPEEQGLLCNGLHPMLANLAAILERAGR